MTAVIDRQDCGVHNTRIDRVLDLYLRQYRRCCALSLEVSVIPYLASLTNLLDTPELRTPELHDRQPAPTPAHCSTLRALPLLVACARPTATTAPPPGAGQIDSFFALLFGSKARVPLEDPIRTRVARGG